MSKISKDACVERSIASKINNFIKDSDKMLLKVLFKFLMLLEDGTVNFIVYKTKFISIGKKLTDKLLHSFKQKIKKILHKKKLRFLNSKKENIGRELGK